MHQEGSFIKIVTILTVLMVAFSMGIWAMANAVPSEILNQSVRHDAQGDASDRIERVGNVRTSPEEHGSETPPADTAAAAPAESDAASGNAVAAVDGEQIYSQACFACHAAGVAGAPAYGDQTAWTARLEQGLDALYEHSISGFQGETGVMPPKGGRMDLSDDAIRAAVDYMVEAVSSEGGEG